MKIFLSSSFRSRDEMAAPDVVALRRDLQGAGEKIGAEIVLAEDDPAVAAAAARGDDIGILAGCASVLSECDAFVALLHERHGQKVTLQGHGIAVVTGISIFETELLNAAMAGKPVLVLQVDEFLPNRALGEFLRLVDPVLGPCRRRVRRADIVTEMTGFVRALDVAPRPRGGRLFDLLGRSRIRADIDREALDPGLVFLNGAYRGARAGEPDTDLARQALQTHDAGVDATGARLHQVARLSLLWAAIRTLVTADERARHDDLLELWTQTLSRWNSAAAWYGLHGAHPLGCLAALNTIAEAHRARPRLVRAPHGGRASAYYSIANRAGQRGLKRRYYRQALALSERQVAGAAGLDRASALGMRGSCKVRLATVGVPIEAIGALLDYREALRLREKFDAGPSQVGESRTEYAFALSRVPWQRRMATRLMEEGVAELRNAPDFDARLGFYLRALRKQAVVLAAAERDAALAALETALALAREAQINDQAGQIEQELRSLRGA